MANDIDGLEGYEIGAFFDTLARLRVFADKWFNGGDDLTDEEDDLRSDCAHAFFAVGEKSGFTPRQLVVMVLSEIDGFVPA